MNAAEILAHQKNSLTMGVASQKKIDRCLDPEVKTSWSDVAMQDTRGFCRED
jgi:hypothetical protein